jgi:hypothetical protein
LSSCSGRVAHRMKSHTTPSSRRALRPRRPRAYGSTCKRAWLFLSFFVAKSSLRSSLCASLTCIGLRNHIAPSPRFFNTMLSLLAQRGLLSRLVYFTDLMREKVTFIGLCLILL